jgi:serine/threonine protein kinase/class 3 adenylate cyclase
VVQPVDQTMPALFAPAGSSTEVVPLAQLGAGSDGSSILARKADQLVEIITPSFAPDSPRWHQLEARLRAVGQVDHPVFRHVLGLDTSPPQIILEGDNTPPLAELVDQTACDMTRVLRILGEVARGIAALHHYGLVHGRLQPWAVHVGASDRPRLELTGLVTRPGHPWSARCVAPEVEVGGAPDATSDVYALGALLQLCAEPRAASDMLRGLIDRALSPDPDTRPSALELSRTLGGTPTKVTGRVEIQPDPELARPSRPGLGLRLGRFELVRQLGVGAMGEVWEARDSAGGPNVAIKLLKPEIAADAELLRRFRKEARVLAKVGSPFIANFIDLNEDRGLHYLVLELVAGGSVAAAQRRLSRFPERFALDVIADTCRALVEPHRLGIVHRDIKPDNMMFVRAGLELERAPVGQVVKLGDFGIARLVEQHSEGMTREGAVLGTPEFMAPEQCQGAQVTPATDVYALGCCLYALIAGEPPFVVKDDNQMAVILAHLNEPAPRLDVVMPEVSPTVAALVARCLDKDPKKRPQDAAEMLAAIEQLCDGAAALITAHPAPPVVRERSVVTYLFEWDLQSSPAALWPFVSNTEKMNRATGLAPVRFEIESTTSRPQGSTNTTGNQRVAGIQMKWREHPYEWIEGSRHVVLRVFEKGVLRWYVAEVTLESAPGGGTKLRNRITMEPRSWIARVLSKFEIGVRYKRRLDRVYTRLDGVLSAGPRPEIDPIDPDVAVAASARGKIEKARDALATAGIDEAAIEALTAYLLHASDQDVARIRPLELAAKFGVPEDAMVDAALHATRLGLLAMVWDVICPSCQIPSSVVESLQKIEEHGACKACNIGFEVDFSRAIELAFRAAPDIRDVETRTFCIGGPAHFPHVAAQVRLQPGERFALPLALPAGYYLLRSPQVPRAHELRVTASGGVRRVDLTLGERQDVPALTAGDQLITIVNEAPREVVVRVERAGDRAFALTAARVMAHAAFRELFPDQALAPGRLMAVTQATLVVAQLDDAQTLFKELGDSKAFPVAARFFELVATLAKEYGGSLVKTFGGLAIAGFERPGPAVDMALGIQKALDKHPVTTGLRARILVHRGPMMALTQAGRLDYFGQNVELALALVPTVPAGVVGLTQMACQDVGVAERLQGLPDQLGVHPVPGSWVLHVGSPGG